MTTANPTAPEPGQPFPVEAAAVDAITGGVASLVEEIDYLRGQLTAAMNFERHPADVPPQPPVLAEGTPVVLSGSETPYVISAIENHCDGPNCRQVTVRLWTHHSAAEKLADVPGPDDTTPEPARCDGCDGTGVIQTADGWENCDHCVTDEEPPPAGEGAALIAATEQEIAEGEDCIGIIQQREAWEATARRACARVDELLAQVQATTHGEAGEAQTGVQAAPRVANSSTGANGSLPAVQGAGRADHWRRELEQLRGAVEAVCGLLDRWANMDGAVAKDASANRLRLAMHGLAQLLRDGLTATAPATQDGSQT